jgi:hypothetical protein
MYTETAWTFETAQFRVELEISESVDAYDGDDDIVQVQLENGNYTMFDSLVRVVHKATGAELGSDSLSGSVYAKPADFWRSHWASPAEGRNCSAHSHRVGHYFPEMVREACKAARQRLVELGGIRIRI